MRINVDEHPEILQMPRLQDALYPRGKQMLADADRKRETVGAPDFAQRKVRMREQTWRVITRTEDPDYGSIRAGKAADLLLLDADPTVDINNTIKIGRVMRAGRWIP